MLTYTFNAKSVYTEYSSERSLVEVAVQVDRASTILSEMDSQDILDFIDRDAAFEHFKPTPDDLDEDDMVDYLRGQGWAIEG